MSRPTVIACMFSSSDSWELQQHPRLWHSRAGGGAVHSINSGHWNSVATCPLCAISGHRCIYSITSSAVVSSDCGTVSPSAFAVLRLMTRLAVRCLLASRYPGEMVQFAKGLRLHSTYRRWQGRVCPYISAVEHAGLSSLNKGQQIKFEIED